jgi:hypothetical protein
MQILFASAVFGDEFPIPEKPDGLGTALEIDLCGECDRL